MREELSNNQIIHSSETIPVVIKGNIGLFPTNEEVSKRSIYGLLVTANGGVTENGDDIATESEAKNMMIVIESEKRRIELPLSYFIQNNGKFGKVMINGYNTSKSKITSPIAMNKAILLTFIFVKE